MEREPSELRGKERERVLGIVKNLVSDLQGLRTETGPAISRHLQRLKLNYPVTVIFYSFNKMEDRKQVTNDKEFLEAVRRGPISEEIRKTYFRVDIVESLKGS